MRLPFVLAAACLAGCGSNEPAPTTLLDQAESLIESPYYGEESLAWAEALGMEAVEADCNGKFARLLERRPVGPDRCEFLIPINPADAVMVSRPLLEELPPLLSLLDMEGLDAYRGWATRPESAGLDRKSPSEMRIQANLGPDDVILLREPFGAGWSTTTDAQISADPIGFTVVDPGRAGEFSTTLRRLAGPSREPAPLPVHPTPRIRPDGVTAAPDYRQGPFRAGDYLVLFGEGFLPHAGHVEVNDRVLDAAYIGRTQINVQLPEDLSPGEYELRVQAGPAASHPVALEVRP